MADRDPTIPAGLGGLPPSIRPALADYLRLAGEEVPGLLTGFYLHGSIALGAYEPGQSDVDFVAVVSRPIGQADLRGLAALHRAVARRHAGCLLEGSYLPWRDLGRLPGDAAPAPYYDAHDLHPAGYRGLDPVTWWVLKRRGIALLGPEPAALPFLADPQALLRYTATNLDSYWAGALREPRRLAALLTDYGVQWTVLGICRLLYTLQEGDVPAKAAAGEYALALLPARWHPILQEALAIRRGLKARPYRWRLARARAAAGFLRYMIDLGHTLAGTVEG